MVARVDGHGVYDAVAGGIDGGLHFHGFDDDEFVAFCDFVARGGTDAGYEARDGCTDLPRVGGVGLRAAFGFGLDGAVEDDALAWAAVEFEGECALAVFIGLAHVNEFDDEDLAFFDFDGDFLAGFESVEEGGCGKDGGAAEVSHELFHIGEDLGIHQMAVEVVVVDVAMQFGGEFGACCFEVHFLSAGSRAACVRFAVAEDDALDIFGPTATGLAESSGEHVNDGLREVGARLEVDEVAGFDAFGEEIHGEVADDFAAGGDFDDVAEDLVDFLVVADDFRPAGAEAEGTGLLAKVGVLAARHFVPVNFCGAELGACVKGFVELSDGLPVDGEFVEEGLVEAGVAFVAAEGMDDGIEVGLGGEAGHGSDGEVHGVGAGLGGFDDGGAADAAGVVGVEVDGKRGFGAEGFDQFVGGSGVAEPGHVFDGEDVGAHALEFFGQLDVVGEGVFVAAVVEDVAGVADGGFADGACVVAYGFDGHLEVGQVIE